MFAYVNELKKLKNSKPIGWLPSPSIGHDEPIEMLSPALDPSWRRWICSTAAVGEAHACAVA
jgi:hypothetical protein